MEKYRKMQSGGYLQLPICDKTVVTELSGDFTLPDYQPEIKRLLRVGASVLPPSKYIGDREAEFAGNIDYYVLYTGSDNELYCAPLTAEYKVNIPIERGEVDESGSLVDPIGDVITVTDMISGRVTAPRKISIKCRLRSRALIFGDMPLESRFGEGEDSVRVLTGEMKASRVLQSGAEHSTLSDEMICDNKDGDLRVISAEGKVMMSEIAPSVDAVSCRGDVYLTLLISREDGSRPYTSRRKLPFSCAVPVDGVVSGCGVNAKGTVSEMNITVEEGRIGIDMGIIVEAEARRDETVPYIKDMYSVARHTDNTYKDVSLTAVSMPVCGNFTLSDSLALSEVGIPENTEIISVSGSASADEYSFEGDKCIIGGKAKFAILADRDGEYTVFDLDLPFSYRAPFVGDFDSASCCTEIVSAVARLDGERIGIDAEVSISGSAMKRRAEKMLADVGFGDEISRERGEYVICYPMSGDSLWSVAKRYGAPTEKLIESNGIAPDVTLDSEDSLDGLNYVVI